MNTRLQMLRLMGCKFHARKWEKRETIPHGTYLFFDIITATIKGPTGLLVTAESDTCTECEEKTGDHVGEVQERGFGDFSDSSDVNRLIAEAIYEAIENGDIGEHELFEHTPDPAADHRPR